MLYFRKLGESLGARVIHVHLTAKREVLSARYLARDTTMKEYDTYDPVWNDPIKIGVRALMVEADVSTFTDIAANGSRHW